MIGRRCKHLTVADALDAVLGYSIMNDLTSITLKSDDTIVTRDDIADANKLAIRVLLGDEEVTTDNTANLRHSVQDLLAPDPANVWPPRSAARHVS